MKVQNSDHICKNCSEHVKYAVNVGISLKIQFQIQVYSSTHCTLVSLYFISDMVTDSISDKNASKRNEIISQAV